MIIEVSYVVAVTHELALSFNAEINVFEIDETEFDSSTEARLDTYRRNWLRRILNAASNPPNGIRYADVVFVFDRLLLAKKPSIDFLYNYLHAYMQTYPQIKIGFLHT